MGQQESKPEEEAGPVAVAQLVRTPSGIPPARVRALFNMCDANGDGKLTFDELKEGLSKDLDPLPPHALEAITKLFEAHAIPDDELGKVIPSGSFSRFYAEILFERFDVNRRGSLQQDEAQEALKFLSKKNADGVRPEVIIDPKTFPPTAFDANGELSLPKAWFFSVYKNME